MNNRQLGCVLLLASKHCSSECSQFGGDRGERSILLRKRRSCFISFYGGREHRRGSAGAF